MSFNPFRLPRYERRKWYYWSGLGAILIGILLLVLLLLRHAVTDRRQVPAFVGGYCAVFATLLSLFQILEHLSCFSDPECQTKIVRILFMVPVYAMISWISILAPSAAEVLALIRDAYESYAIYAFFSLMLSLMGGPDTLHRTLMIEGRPPLPHPFPLCHLRPIRISPGFITTCRRCVFQFMVCKPLTTLVILILRASGGMGDSFWDLAKGRFWTVLVYNVSITIAFTALVYFYLALHDLMEGKQALAKFICIKAVIFLSYWQGFAIAIVSSLGALPDFDYWAPVETAEGLQNLLICVEMLLIAFGHKYCFGSDEYALDEVDVDGGVTSGADVFQFHHNRPFYRPRAAADDIDPDEPPPMRHGRPVAPIRLSIKANLKYTLRHADIRSDFEEITQST